jgi:hypothetical protein
VADALAVLGREQQVDGERGGVVGHTGDRGGVQRPPFGDEPLGAPAGLDDRGLAVLLDVVEDRPVVPLDLVLGVGGTLAMRLRQTCCLCRRRHKLHYADLGIMPMLSRDPLQGSGFTLGRSA